MDANEASVWNTGVTAAAAILGAAVGAAGALFVERTRRREERSQRLADSQRTAYEDFLRGSERVRIALIVPDVPGALESLRAARELLGAMALVTSRPVMREATRHLSALSALLGAVDALQNAHVGGATAEIDAAATLADQRLADLSPSEGALVDAMRRHLGLTDLLPAEAIERSPNHQ